MKSWPNRLTFSPVLPVINGSVAIIPEFMVAFSFSL